MHENFTLSENDIAMEDIDTVNELMRQLTPNATILDLETIQHVMKNGFILTLRDNGTIVGMASLIPARKLFAFFGSVEDVVVNEKYRGQGLGKKLTHAIIAKGQELKMKYLDLTSSPKREAANGLYQSVGFEKRDTNVYRLKF